MFLTAKLETQTAYRVSDCRAAELRFDDDRLTIGLSDDDVGASVAADKRTLPLRIRFPAPAYAAQPIGDDRVGGVLMQAAKADPRLIA